MASKHQLSGMRGVFLVAAELSELGFVVSPTSRSAQGVDLLATNWSGARTFTIEVKSTARSNFWIVGASARKPIRNNVWVFVKFGKPRERARFFVVPSKSLRQHVTKGKTTAFFVKRKAIAKFEEKWSAFGRNDMNG